MPQNEKKQGIIESWWTFLEDVQEQNKKMATSFFEGMKTQFPLPPTLIGDTFIKAGQALLSNPSQLLNAQSELLEEIQALWQKMLDSKNQDSIGTPPDKRFRHEAWTNVPYFLFMKEYYLITSRWLEKLLSEIC